MNAAAYVSACPSTVYVTVCVSGCNVNACGYLISHQWEVLLFNACLSFLILVIELCAAFVCVRACTHMCDCMCVSGYIGSASSYLILATVVQCCMPVLLFPKLKCLMHCIFIYTAYPLL